MGVVQKKERYDTCMHAHMYTCTHTHTVEYNSAMKKNEMLPFAAVWMDLQNIMLSEINQRRTNTV